MICIWDNNGDYSDHAVHFTKMDDSVMSNEEFEQLLPYTSRYYPIDGSGHKTDAAYVEAWAKDGVDWRRDGFEEVWEAIEPECFITSKPGADPNNYSTYTTVKRAGAWNKSIIERLIPHWEAMYEEWHYAPSELDNLNDVKRLLSDTSPEWSREAK